VSDPTGDPTIRARELVLFHSNLELLTVKGLVELIDHLERRAEMSSELAIARGELTRRQGEQKG